ncbi:LacI family DNA-binding transcriptional regulator [Actinopolymorpha singaporensis]|uniref:Transcriptional regulator, LacI family n=1 Tax=Actinopolymorpha singaporensis TaxID=117157 RepID=A0A1H1V1N9_9ACTN|nr:LacI family DNA-binding transcriptional regulator [Actinopolymorpha singaporensis]SDS78672.1 transcriptional regulator, LacI family [Actinopolymorpha singaporensis]
MPKQKAPAADTGRPRVTITQVAAHAGVSPTTVSHVLSGKRLVAEETQATVHEAIRTLGYRPNHVARSLRTRRSQMIAVVVPDITNTFYSVLTRGLADVVDADGYGTYVCNTDGLPDRETKFFEDILDRGADGIVLAAVDEASVGALGPANMGVPVVSIGERLDHPEVDVVTVDDEVGAYAATTHLLGRGARRVAMISGPSQTGRNRVAGFRRALSQARRRANPSLLVAGDWTRQGGRDAMRSLLALPARRRPDAVFCANDLTAIGAIDALREAGLNVPDDVAVAGFDDVDAATIVHPALTTVVNPAYEIGATAGRLLTRRLRGERDRDRTTVVLPCPLVVRGSA